MDDAPEAVIMERLLENPVVDVIVEPDEEELVAAADVHDGAMIALIPAGEDLDRLVVEGGEPIDQLHLTMMYLGDAIDIGDQERADIIHAMTDFAERQPSIIGQAFGCAAFNPLGDEPCIVIIVGGDVLAEAHDSIVSELDGLDLELPEQHMPWLGHVTLAYEPKPMTDYTLNISALARGRMGPITFDRLRVAFGGVTTDVPLGENTLIASEVFHLGGKHNQKSHGHGGGAAMATVDDDKIKKARASFDERAAKAKTEGAAYTTMSHGLGLPDGEKNGVDNAETKAALGKYAGSSGFHDVNQGLRDAHGHLESAVKPPAQPGHAPSPIQSDAELRDTISGMDRGMDASHLSDDIIVHRVVAGPDHLFGSAYHMDGDNSGLTWSDHGFTSTTILEGAVGFQSSRIKGGQEERMGPQLHLRILAPKGSHALVGRNDEGEVILDRGTRFRVVRDYGIDDRTRRDMELGITEGYLRRMDVEIIE